MTKSNNNFQFEIVQNIAVLSTDKSGWATHDAKWRGNWSPYISSNIILVFAGRGNYSSNCRGGTTLIETRLLIRDIILENKQPEV